MTVTELLSYQEHPLETRGGGGKEEVIITVAKYSSICAVNSAAGVPFVENAQDLEAVEAVGKFGQNFVLPNSVCDEKTF